MNLIIVGVVAVVVVLFIIVMWVIKTYNKLQSGKQVIVEKSSNIQVSLQKRRDLAARIIDIAKGFSDHEKVTHMKVSASTENLSALAQHYPELKANETYLKLMQQLEVLENGISNKRESYNNSSKEYNVFRSSFPAMLVAGKLKFEASPYYDANDEESLSKLASFSRDDAEAVQELISSSKESLKSSATNFKNSAASQFDEVKNSDAVKSAIVEGQKSSSKIISAVKKKTDELTHSKAED